MESLPCARLKSPAKLVVRKSRIGPLRFCDLLLGCKAMKYCEDNRRDDFRNLKH